MVEPSRTFRDGRGVAARCQIGAFEAQRPALGLRVEKPTVDSLPTHPSRDSLGRMGYGEYEFFAPLNSQLILLAS